VLQILEKASRGGGMQQNGLGRSTKLVCPPFIYYVLDSRLKSFETLAILVYVVDVFLLPLIYR